MPNPSMLIFCRTWNSGIPEANNRNDVKWAERFVAEAKQFERLCPGLAALEQVQHVAHQVGQGVEIQKTNLFPESFEDLDQGLCRRLIAGVFLQRNKMLFDFGKKFRGIF